MCYKGCLRNFYCSYQESIFSKKFEISIIELHFTFLIFTFQDHSLYPGCPCSYPNYLWGLLCVEFFEMFTPQQRYEVVNDKAEMHLCVIASFPIQHMFTTCHKSPWIRVLSFI